MRFRNQLTGIALSAAMLLAACSTAVPEAKEPISSKITVHSQTKSSTTQSVTQLAASTGEGKLRSASSSSQAANVLAPTVKLSTTAPVVGETMTIRVENAKKVSASAFLGFVPKFFQQGNAQVALLPISYTVEPGVYRLKIVADGKESVHSLTVTNRAFDEQYLTVDPTTTQNTAGSADANNEWAKRVEPLKQVGDTEQHWQGKFIVPIDGDLTNRITTEYGSIRYTNGSTVATRHSGIDLAFKTGTPVLATGNGRVLFADFLQLTGNTVVIEHGYGLKSFYYHMDSLNTKEGETVTQGQQIGAVGSTGFSTGPHCHFGMAVNDVFTNPWTLIEQGLQ